MAYSQDQANKYYNTMTAEQKAAVDASGGPSIEWFTNAVNAGVPGAVKAAGSRAAEEAEGGIADFSDAASSAEWMGKRKPTPRELRKWATEQHARYVAGDSSAQDEDYERYDDRQLAAWIANSWKGDHFENDFGDRVGKPTESGPNSKAAGYATGEKSGKTGGGGGGGFGGGYGPPPPPPKPVTFGQQLSLTGNPMQDMLIQQFNARTQLNDPSQANIFGMGMDRAVGGTDANADNPMMAQTLAGGGLWRGSKDTFGSFRADEKNILAEKKKKKASGGGGGGATTQAPSPAEIAQPPGLQTGVQTGLQPIRGPVSPMTGMLRKTFGPKDLSGEYVTS